MTGSERRRLGGRYAGVSPACVVRTSDPTLRGSAETAHERCAL